MPVASPSLRSWLVRLQVMKTWRSPDGTTWVVDVVLPGSSNAMVMFYHPGGKTARLDRYNWYISNGPEARSVTSRLSEIAPRSDVRLLQIEPAVGAVHLALAAARGEAAIPHYL